MISLGSDFLRMSVYSEVEPLPPHVSIIQIGLRDWEMGKNYPAEIALRADIKETLRALTPLIAELGGAVQGNLAAERISRIRAAQLDCQSQGTCRDCVGQGGGAADRCRVADADDHRHAAARCHRG